MKKVVQYVNKVAEKFYARKKVLPFVLNPPLATVIGESGFEAQAGRIIVSGYSGVCFEIKFSGRHRGFDTCTL